MKEEAQGPVRARLTLGDVAFGLEIARWRTRRLLNGSEWVRRLCGIRRLQSSIARPGLLLVEITGLNHESLEAALKAGSVPFLRSLLQVESYELWPLKLQTPIAQLVKTARADLESHRIGLVPVAKCWRPWRPPLTLWPELELAAGSPLVHLRLPAGEDSRVTTATNTYAMEKRWEKVDRTIGRLNRKALLSATADYEVWIVADGANDGFALLPANAIRPDASQQALDLTTLQSAMLRALSLPFSPPILKRSRTRPENAIRVMTYNVHSCVGLDGKLAPSRIARIIRSFDPDIIALQEVDLKRARSKGEDQAARLARELDMRVIFCCTAERAWERYGHALLTRFPATVIASGLFPGEQQLAEPRGALLARIEMAGRSLYVVNTHFGLNSRDRLKQAKILLGPEWLGRVPGDMPLIVCGDFNMSPASQPYALMTQHVMDAQVMGRSTKSSDTFPSPMPVTCLDFIFLSNHLMVKRVLVAKNKQTRVASDHLPVVADLSL